jgi:hypothetical protein
MNAHELAKMLLNESADAEVYLIDPSDQSFYYDFQVCSNTQGVPEIPQGEVMLLPALNSIYQTDDEEF